MHKEVLNHSSVCASHTQKLQIQTKSQRQGFMLDKPSNPLLTITCFHKENAHTCRNLGLQKMNFSSTVQPLDVTSSSMSNQRTQSFFANEQRGELIDDSPCNQIVFDVQQNT
jgi:hypothetical protein